MTQNPSRQAAAGQTLPLWIKVLAVALAVVQWGFFARLLALSQDVLAHASVPLALVRLATLGAAIALSALALLAWLSPTNRLLQRGYAALQKLRWHPLSLALPALCVASGIFLFLRGDLYTLLSIQLGLVALLLYLAGPSAWAVRDSKWLMVVPVLVILLGLGLRLWLLFVDWVWTDEGFHISAAINMLEGGGIAPAIMHFPDGILIAPWRGFAFGVYGLWARIFGVGLMQARALAYLFGLLALPFIYATSRLWYGQRTAWVTTSIATLSILFLRSTSGRTDSLPLAAISLVVFAHVYACHKQRPVLHVAVGLLAVLALETHYANLVFLVPLGGYYAVEYLAQVREDGRWLRPAPLWFYLAGAVPGLLVYSYVHFLTLPHLSALLGAGEGFVGSGSIVVSRLDTALTRLEVFWYASPPEALLIVAATAAALVRRTQADKHWLLLFAFTQIAYVVLGPYANLHHTVYGLPIFIGSAGALVTYGFDKREQRGSLWERVTCLAIIVVLSTYAVSTIRFHKKNGLALDRQRRPIVEYIRDNLPTDAGIIGPSVFYPYLVEYRTYMIRGYPAGLRGPALAGMETEAYWQNVLLDTWPVARIAPPTPFDEIQVYDSYMAARHAREVVPDLWVVADGDLVTDAGYAEPLGEAALQMVAHVGLPPSVEPGATLQLGSLWVTRQPIAHDYFATLSLTGQDGKDVILQTDQLLVSGWAGTATSSWPANQFHDVAFALHIPHDLPPGTYALHLDLHTPSGDGPACAPRCQFTIDELSVALPQ